MSWRLLVSLFLLFWTSTTLAAGSSQFCTQDWSRAWLDRSLNSQQLALRLESSLVCQTEADDLSVIGGQYLVLKRLGLRLSSGAFDPYRLQSFGTTLQLQLPLDTWRSRGESAEQVQQRLRVEIFPQLFLANQAQTTLVAQAFDRVIHQLIQFADTPPEGFVETGTNHYSGSLDQPYEYYLNHLTAVPLIAGFVPTVEQWQGLQKFMARYQSCATRCLMRLEKRVVQAIVLFLGRADLAERILSRDYPEFIPRLLPKRYGCNTSYLDRPTGSFMNYNEGMPQYLEMDLDAALGRPVYIQAIDFPAVNDGIMRGQNGIIRKITPAAFADLKSLGGFGANRDLAYTLEPQWSGLRTTTAISQDFSGLSRLMVLYWLARHEGREQDAVAIIDRPVFNGISFSEGHSLRWWVEFGYRRNPNTPYQFFGLDYGFYPSRDQRSTFYDRLVEALR